MKKTRNIYILVGLIVVIALAMITVFFLDNGTNEPDSHTQGEINAQEYLLVNSLEKAPAAEDIILLHEGKDCSFVSTDEGLKKTAGEIAESIFDAVIIKSVALSDKNTTALTEAEQTKIKKICDYFVSKNKRVYVYCTAYLSETAFKSISTFAHGAVVDTSEVEAANADKLATKLEAIRENFTSRQLLLFSKDTSLIEKTNKNCVDGIFITVSGDADAEKFRQLQQSFSQKGISSFPFVDLSLYPQQLTSDEALRAIYSLRDYGVKKRAYSSYADVRSNKDNCFGAIETYIKTGISPLLAFRGINIRNYKQGDLVRVDEGFCKVNVTTSYLFPLYINGKSEGILPLGRGEIRLELLQGENSFIFSQLDKTVEYKAEFVFDGNLIESVSPSDSVRVSPGEKIVVMVVAYSEAEVSVRLGSAQFPAKKQQDSKGYAAFYAEVIMPADADSLFSVEKISVVATLGNHTQQAEGAKIIPVLLENTPTISTVQHSFNIQNYNPTYIDIEQQVLPSISEAISKATTNSYYVPFNGNQTAVITAEYADVIPSSSQVTFVPYCTAFAKGTKDFVIGESQLYDNEDKEWYYYYDLACGLKVARENVTLETATSMPENSLTVNSVYNSNGELIIRLKSLWKVPYTTDFKNQSYYSNNSSSYYASSFNATGISFTFHYTTSAQGEIDCSGSDVIASAQWSLSPENKTATLTLPFRQQGVYYGCSIRYEGDETVLTIKNNYKGVQGSVVVLDPGHGGKDSGATGLAGAVKESDINILVAYQVKDYLESQGVTVYMTRYADDDINKEGRKIFARSVNPDLHVGIHSDAISDNPQAIGTTAFYYKPFSIDLATNVHNEIVAAYTESIYANSPEKHNSISRGVKYYPFSPTRFDECPSTMVELGFLTNDNECYMLTLPETQKVLGQAIGVGICKTLTQ